jgi:hypothetical protein
MLILLGLIRNEINVPATNPSSSSKTTLEIVNLLAFKMKKVAIKDMSERVMKLKGALRSK